MVPRASSVGVVFTGGHGQLSKSQRFLTHSLRSVSRTRVLCLTTTVTKTENIYARANVGLLPNVASVRISTRHLQMGISRIGTGRPLELHRRTAWGTVNLLKTRSYCSTFLSLVLVLISTPAFLLTLSHRLLSPEPLRVCANTP